MRSGLEGSRHAQRPAGVAGPHRSGQPVGSVVGDRHRVGLIGEGDDRRHRAEHLLAGHSVEVARLDQGAGVPVAGTGRRAAAEETGAVDEGGHRRPMLGRDQRAHLGGRILGVTYSQPGGGIHEQPDEPVVDRALDQDPGAGAAVLPGIPEDSARSRRRRPLQVAVLEDDVRRLAAQLQGDPLDPVRSTAHDLPADLGRPGEADLGDVGVLDQAIAHHPPGAHHHVDHPLGDARLEYELREAQRRQRGQLRRLEHGRVAAGECRVRASSSRC